MARSKSRIVPAAGVLLTFQDVNNGTRSTLREFRAELSKLHRDALLYFCALANNLLFRDPRRFDTQMHNEFVRRFLPTDILNNVARRRGGPQCVVFNRRQLLFLAKEALFNCSVSVRLWHPQDESLGKVLLMANDQLEYDLPSTTDPLEDLIQTLVQFLPVG